MLKYCPKCRSKLNPGSDLCSNCGYKLNTNTVNESILPDNLIRYENCSLEETEDTCINCNKILYSIEFNDENHLICLNCGLDLNVKDSLYSLQDILDKNNSLWIEYSYNYFTYDELNHFRLNKKSLLEQIPKKDSLKKEYNPEYFIEKIKHLPSNLLKYQDILPKMKSTDIKCANCNGELYSIMHADSIFKKNHLICLECGLDLLKYEEDIFKLVNIYNNNSYLWTEYHNQKLSLDQWENIRTNIHPSDELEAQIILTDNLNSYIPFISVMNTSNNDCILCTSKLLFFTDENDKIHHICKNCGLDFIETDNEEYYLNDFNDKNGEFWFYYKNKQYSYDNWKNLVKTNINSKTNHIDPDIDLSRLPVNIIKNYIDLLDNLIDSHQNCFWCDSPLYYLTKQTILTTEEHCICLDCGLDFKLSGFDYQLYEYSKKSKALGDLHCGESYPIDYWPNVISEEKYIYHNKSNELNDLISYLNTDKNTNVPLKANEKVYLVIDDIKAKTTTSNIDHGIFVLTNKNIIIYTDRRTLSFALEDILSINNQENQLVLSFNETKLFISDSSDTYPILYFNIENRNHSLLLDKDNFCDIVQFTKKIMNLSYIKSFE